MYPSPSSQRPGGAQGPQRTRAYALRNQNTLCILRAQECSCGRRDPHVPITRARDALRSPLKCIRIPRRPRDAEDPPRARSARQTCPVPQTRVHPRRSLARRSSGLASPDGRPPILTIQDRRMAWVGNPKYRLRGCAAGYACADAPNGTRFRRIGRLAPIQGFGLGPVPLTTGTHARQIRSDESTILHDVPGCQAAGALFHAVNPILCRAPHLCSAAEAVPTASPPATPAGVMMDTLRMAARRERRAGPCEGASLCLARVLWRASSALASEQVACRLPARPPCPAHALAARCACGRGHLASRAAARRKQCSVARAHFIFHALLARVVQLLRCPALRALRWRRLRWLWLLSKGLPEGHGARRGREVVARPGAAAAAEV